MTAVTPIGATEPNSNHIGAKREHICPPTCSLKFKPNNLKRKSGQDWKPNRAGVSDVTTQEPAERKGDKSEGSNGKQCVRHADEVADDAEHQRRAGAGNASQRVEKPE